jgi:hypothetical protein
MIQAGAPVFNPPPGPWAIKQEPEPSRQEKLPEPDILRVLADEPPFEAYSRPLLPLAFEEPRFDAVAEGQGADGPQCNSAALTRRLVAASMQFVVNNILGDAYGALVNLRVAAAQVPEEDRDAYDAAIRRLNVLVNRAHRKLGDLNKEDDLRLKQHKAERRREADRAEAIKAELRRRIRERQERERGYLNETGDDTPLDAGTEAMIAAEAKMIAATMPGMAPVMTGSDADVSIAGVSASGEASAAIDTGEGAPAAEGDG